MNKRTAKPRKRYGGIEPETAPPEAFADQSSVVLRIAANGCLLGAVEALNDVIEGKQSGLADYQLMTRRARAIAVELSKRHAGGQLHLYTRIDGMRER